MHFHFLRPRLPENIHPALTEFLSPLTPETLSAPLLSAVLYPPYPVHKYSHLPPVLQTEEISTDLPARQPRRYDSSGSTVPLLPDLPAAMPADFRVPLHFSDTHKESCAPAKYVPDTGEAFLLPPAGLSY